MLTSTGIRVSERRVGDSLARVAPTYQAARQQIWPGRIPYCADYPGHKVHIDQKRKAVPHVAAVDGYSGLIAGLVTMPVKNPILVYDMLYRYLLANQTRSPTLAVYL